MLADFSQMLAKKTPEFFDKTKAGEFTLNSSMSERGRCVFGM